MGALDFLKGFKNRVLDAATYELLERNFRLQVENGRLYKDKAEELQQENVRLKAENKGLSAELSALTEKLSRITDASQYVKRGGFAFCQKPDGSFDETPYCPNCFSVMGQRMRGSYNCPSCGYIQTSRTLPETFARQLNAKPQENV